MPFYAGSTSSAETLVATRFDDATDFANRAKKEIFALIKELVAIAKAASGVDIDATLPLTQPDIPDVSPFYDKLTSGETGIDADDDAAIWQRGLDRAAEVYAESIEIVDEHFTGFSAVPSEMYYALVQAQLNRYSWELSDLARYETSKGFNVAAEFSKFITGQIMNWTLAMKGAEAKQAIAIAELQLKQIEVEIREFLEKAGVELAGYMAAGDTAAHLAAAAMQAVSASASISDSGSDGVSTTAATSVSNEVRTGTSETRIESDEDSTKVITGEE